MTGCVHNILPNNTDSSWFQGVMSPITVDHVTVTWLVENLSVSPIIRRRNGSALLCTEVLCSYCSVHLLCYVSFTVLVHLWVQEYYKGSVTELCCALVRPLATQISSDSNRAGVALVSGCVWRSGWIIELITITTIQLCHMVNANYMTQDGRMTTIS